MFCNARSHYHYNCHSITQDNIDLNNDCDIKYNVNLYSDTYFRTRFNVSLCLGS